MPHARVEERDIEAGEPERARREPAPAAAAVLALQRGVGNQAVGRMLARRVAAKPKPKHTGMRDDAAIARYVHKAVLFRRNNPTAKLVHFATFLVAAANTELNQLGIPDVKWDIKRQGPGGAHFDAENWLVVVNGFGQLSGDDTLDAVSDDAAAVAAMSVYHEARHAEQRFRVARMNAGEQQDPGFVMEEGAAAEAAAQPMDKRATPAHEVAEAKEWRENQSGEDALYREAVTSWQRDVSTMTRLARDVASDSQLEPETVRERIGRNLASWDTKGQMWVVRGHLASAQRRKRAPMVADIELMIRHFDAAMALWRGLADKPARTDFAGLADALRELVRAIDTAYRNQPVEKDAHETGHATFDAFHAELAK